MSKIIGFQKREIAISFYKKSLFTIDSVNIDIPSIKSHSLWYAGASYEEIGEAEK